MYATAKGPPRIVHKIDEELFFHEPKKVSRSGISPDGPPPDTRAGLIVCYACSVFTRHTFAGRRQVFDSVGNVLYNELVYLCPCGKERVWGTESLESSEDVARSK